MYIFLCRQHLLIFVKRVSCPKLPCTSPERLKLGIGGPKDWSVYIESRDSWFEAQSTWTWQLPITFSCPLTHTKPSFCPALLECLPSGSLS